jgi:glycosyltransferase involved in cell wall biosynthesis
VSRPSVTVVMPFAGEACAADAAVQALLELECRPGDELILADNAGVADARGEVRIARATGEQSPAHARNAGAEQARGDWILFLDADCRAPSWLIDAYFVEDVAPEVGALAGEVIASSDGLTLAARYGAARSFLGQESHLAHPYMPRAAAANLMVRRAAFEQVGGFYEGVRAAEDTDFSWRLQQAGWRLELRPNARVEHTYRATVGELRSQWRGYAAGRAWLSRRYEGFEPEPALRRVIRRAAQKLGRRGTGARRDRAGGVGVRRGGDDIGRLERGRYFALDALLAAEELRGLALSNRPPREPAPWSNRVVLVADRFPAREDPLVEFALTLDRARVEAAARPDVVSADVARELEIDYREDEGAVARTIAIVKLVAHHPVRCAVDVLRRPPGSPGLAALAPAAIRLEHDGGARLHALGGEEAQASAARLAALTRRRIEDRERS